MAEIEKRHLKGLEFHTSKPTETVDENGRKTVKHVSVVKPLGLEHVLGQKDYGTYFMITTSDGKKYRIDKEEKDLKPEGCKKGKQPEGGENNPPAGGSDAA